MLLQNEARSKVQVSCSVRTEERPPFLELRHRRGNRGRDDGSEDGGDDDDDDDDDERTSDARQRRGVGRNDLAGEDGAGSLMAGGGCSLKRGG